MPSFKITAIKVNELLCPLIETGKQSRVTHFRNEGLSPWSGTDDNVKPAALPGEDAKIYVVIEYQGGVLADKTKVTITSKWDQFKEARGDSTKMQSFTKDSDTLWSNAVSQQGVELSLAPLALGNQSTAKKMLPWAYNDIITWTISTGGVNQTISTKLELYVLPKYIPKYMINQGIPLGLLRYETLLPTWMKNKDEKKNDWPIFAVNALFNDPRLSYDNFSGANTYATSGMNFTGRSAAVETAVWIELWLSDMAGLMGLSASKLFKAYPINCYDTAALVQTIASLNLQDDKAESRIIGMDEFGFISETFLLGRHKASGPGPYLTDDLCNNPFYARSGTMKTAQMDTQRHPFVCHYFVTIQTSASGGPTVFDACCGPHAGTEKLEQYLQKAIDQEPLLYSPNVYGPAFPGMEQVVRPLKGKLTNTFSGPGVVSLASAASFTRPLPGKSTEISLFDRMTTAFPSTVTTELRQPFEGSPGGAGIGIVATWTYVNNTADIADQGECQISIWRYKKLEDAKNQYEIQRANLLSDFTETNDNDLTFPNLKPSYYMFYLEITKDGKNNFFVTMEGSMKNAAIKKNVVGVLKSKVLDKELEKKTDIQNIDAPQTAQKVNTTFKITLDVSPAFYLCDNGLIHHPPQPSVSAKSWWRGYKVETAYGVSLISILSFVMRHSIAADPV